MPTTDATLLRSAGRSPALPFEVKLDDGRTLVVNALLRLLPEKRLTGIGTLGGETVLTKLFIAKPGAERHWERERRGLEMLQEKAIPTPRLFASGQLVGGGYYLLTEYIAGAHSPSMLDATELSLVLRTLGRMHAQGLIHQDAHLDNFLFKDGGIYVVDGDAIRDAAVASATRQNLALLLAQLPPEQEARLCNALVSAYLTGNSTPLDMAQLDAAVRKTRARRLDDYLDKCLRDCSLFHVEKSWDRFIAMPRDEVDFLAPIIAAPDRWLEDGIPLKQGRTATLALIEHDGRQLVVKRYNIKGAGHALSRSWRSSRAWHAWVEAHRLGFLGIATPRPLALIERRLGPLRGGAWLITEYCPGTDLSARLAAGALGDEVWQVMGHLFQQLFAARISHGDLKATNLLWHDGRPVLIDLDATQQHAKAGSFQRAWRKDRARFLRNWPEDSGVRGMLDTLLPRI